MDLIECLPVARDMNPPIGSLCFDRAFHLPCVIPFSADERCNQDKLGRSAMVPTYVHGTDGIGALARIVALDGEHV
jgi:hypothetical protein